jgi:hypothetical protein
MGAPIHLKIFVLGEEEPTPPDNEKSLAGHPPSEASA